MMNEHVAAALDALTAEARGYHRSCLRLLEKRNAALASEIASTYSAYFESAGTSKDQSSAAYATLLARLGPTACVMPRMVVATVPRAALWVATGPLCDEWLAVVPAHIISFYRAFCAAIFLARDAQENYRELDDAVKRMSQILGEHLELGFLDLSAASIAPKRYKPIIEHLTQIAYEFFILHEACRVMEWCEFWGDSDLTHYQDVHFRHAKKFSVDKWAFNTLLCSFNIDIHWVTVAIALLFDSLDLLDRYELSPLTRVSNPSPAARKWRIMRLTEGPNALDVLDKGKLRGAREFSLQYERLASAVVDQAKPASPINAILNRGAELGAQTFIDDMLPVLARGDVLQVIHSLASVRSATSSLALEGTVAERMFAANVNDCIDSLALELSGVPRLRKLASLLRNAAARETVSD